jgi:NAD(P)-dependent dehydrogenase (short-subunit alcohol dehydrogenase family)
VQLVSAATDHLDVLVNNAGIILEGDDSITQLEAETVTKTFQTNTLGPLLVTQAFLPLLSQSNRPRVISVSSGGGQLAEGMDTWAPAYCLSKTSLNAVTGLFAAALPDFSINAVCPGWVRTDMGGANATRSVEEGADTMVWLATEAPANLTAKFLRDRKAIAW